jgi:hypothetical protein
MKNQEAQRPLFATLQYKVRQQLDISWAEYVLLDMVYHLAAKSGSCYKSGYSIAADMGITYNGVKRMRRRLLARELLVVTASGLQCGQAYLDIVNSEQSALVNKVHGEQSSLIHREHSEQSSQIVHKVHKSEQSSDKNNNREVQKNNIKAEADPLAVELADFAAMRKAIKKPITPRGLQLIRSKAIKFYPDDVDLQQQCLNQSVENSWAGLYELKNPVRKGKPSWL